MKTKETQVLISPELKIKFDALQYRVKCGASGESMTISHALHLACDLMTTAGALLTETATANFNAGGEDFGFQDVATGENGVCKVAEKLGVSTYKYIMATDTEFREMIEKQEAEIREECARKYEARNASRPTRSELLAACEKWPDKLPCDFEDTNFQKWLFAEWSEHEHKSISEIPLDAGLWTGRDWLDYFENTPFH